MYLTKVNSNQMNEETMQPAQPDDTQEKIVIPLFEIVVYPNNRTKFHVGPTTGELLLAAIKDEGDAYRGRADREKWHETHGTYR